MQFNRLFDDTLNTLIEAANNATKEQLRRTSTRLRIAAGDLPPFGQVNYTRLKEYINSIAADFDRRSRWTGDSLYINLHANDISLHITFRRGYTSGGAFALDATLEFKTRTPAPTKEYETEHTFPHSFRVTETPSTAADDFMQHLKQDHQLRVRLPDGTTRTRMLSFLKLLLDTLQTIDWSTGYTHLKSPGVGQDWNNFIVLRHYVDERIRRRQRAMHAQ
jgi:hypothetical protein